MSVTPFFRLPRRLLTSAWSRWYTISFSSLEKWSGTLNYKYLLKFKHGAARGVSHLASHNLFNCCVFIITKEWRVSCYQLIHHNAKHPPIQALGITLQLSIYNYNMLFVVTLNVINSGARYSIHPTTLQLRPLILLANPKSASCHWRRKFVGYRWSCFHTFKYPSRPTEMFSSFRSLRSMYIKDICKHIQRRTCGLYPDCASIQVPEQSVQHKI